MATSPVFMRDVTILVLEMICAVFCFFCFGIFYYASHIWFWDKFIICMKTKCLVQVICHIGSFIGRNIAAFFWKKCYLHGTKSARNLVADIVVSEFSVDLSSSFSAAFSVGSFDIGIFVIWISSKWDICESPLCDIILLYHKTVQKHTYYF